MDELKPCPFCGGKAELEVNFTQSVYGDFYFIGKVTCTSGSECGAKMELRLALRDTIIDYNASKNYLAEALTYRWNGRVNHG